MVTGFSADPVSPEVLDPVPQAASAAADAVPTATVVRKCLRLITGASLLSVCNPFSLTSVVSWLTRLLKRYNIVIPRIGQAFSNRPFSGLMHLSDNQGVP